MRHFTNLLLMMLLVSNTMLYGQHQGDFDIGNAAPGGASPNVSDDEVIRYDNGVNFDALGLVAGGTFYAAIYFPASTMAQYAGAILYQVEVYIKDAPDFMELQVFGQGTSTVPGDLLTSQTVNPVPMSWILIDLLDPILITGEDLWIGYEVTHQSLLFPAGCDAGPAVAGFGDMISIDGAVWEPMSALGLDYNWNIAGYLFPGPPVILNDVGIQTIVEPTSGVELSASEPVVIKIKNYGTNTQSNIPWEVTWSGARSGSLSGIFAGSLAEGEEAEITAGTADLSSFGVYAFEACTYLSGDEKPSNDCKTKAVTNSESGLCIENLYTSGCDYGDQLTSWDLANINIPYVPCDGYPGWYQDYMDLVHAVLPGETYVLTVTAGYSDTYFAVWVDWDNNLDFAPDEMILEGLCANPGTPYTFDFVVPANIPPEQFVMRARTNWQNPATDPCATYAYGNCCDFMVFNDLMQTPARLQIIHNSADMAVEVVDVWLDDVKLLENFAFRTATPFIDVPTGVEFTIAIQPPGSTSPEYPLWSQDYTLDFYETYLLIASGIVSPSGYDPVEPFDIYVFPLAREEATQAFNTDLLAFHGSTDAPTITVWETGAGAGQIIDDFSYGDFAGYFELETQDYIIEVRDETGTVVVASYSAPFASLGLEGAAVTALASGFLDPSNNSNGSEFGIWVALHSGGDLIPLPVYTPPSIGNPPENLQAELIGDDAVMLTWEPPMEDGDWYHWDSGTNFDGIGLTDGGTFGVAARWTPDQLGAIDGNHLTKVALYPRSDQGASFTLKIYEGANAATLLVSEDITALLVHDEWNTINLTTPVEIDGATELWVGYETTHVATDFPAGTDSGPAVAGFGDMVNFDGSWQPLSGLGLDYNWNIQIFVTDGSDGAVAQPIVHNATYNNANPQLAAGNLKQALKNTRENLRNPLGYNVYRDDEMIAEEITSLDYLDLGLDEGTYSYTVKAVYESGLSDPAGPVSIYVPGSGTGTPSISFSPTSLMETHIEPGMVTYVPLLISNNSDAYLFFGIESLVDWMIVDPVATYMLFPWGSAWLNIPFSSIGLTPGVYEGGLLFDSNDPDSPHTVPATLTIAPEGPVIHLDPTSLIEQHPNPPQVTTKFINVTNQGDEQLDWSLDIETLVSIPQGLDDAAYADALAQRMTEEGSPVMIGRTAAGGASPNMTDDEVIRYDDGINNDAIGLTAGGTFNVAAYFPASTMGQYAGMELAQVEVYINDVPNPMVLQIFGQGTSTVPGDLLASQTVTPGATSWIMIDLDDAVDITGEDLWIGYEVTHSAGTYPAGCDAGPAVAGFGDMISLDGTVYEPMSALGLDYNWNIAGYLVSGGPALPNDVGVQAIVEPTTGVELSASEPVVIKIKNYGTNTQSNIPWEVTWSGAGSGSFSGTLAGPLAAGEEAEVTAGTADLSAYGVYTFEACTDLSGDENAANDCKTKAVESIEPSLCFDNLYTSGCSFGDQLTSWDLANINVPSIPCAGTPPWYQDYMDQVHELEAGMSYTLTVTAGYANTFFAVWIDFDGNLDLTMDEMLLAAECAAANTQYTFDLAIPMDVEDGTFVMRARTNWQAPVTDPCETYTYGQAIDFMAQIGGGTGPSDWLTADPMNGSLAPGASEQVEVTFNSAGLNVGTYAGELIFSSNDPNSPHTVTAVLKPGGIEYPQITVTPDELEELHETPNLITEQTVAVGNAGGADLEWTLEVERSLLYKSTAAPVVRGTVPERNAAAAEQAPGTVFGNETIPTDAEYDLQFEYAVGVGGGEAGIETDGSYIYTTKWNGADFYRYQTDGTYLETFTVPGASAVRDLAYDGVYFYGGAAATTVFEMDFDSETLISTFMAPTAVRAIGYDDVEDGFWANNWSTTLTLFDRSGATLSTIPTNGDESFYGLAYDPQGPYLWGYSQRTGSSQNLLYKYALPSGAFLEEFDVFPLLSMPITGDIAGGLAFHPDIVPGTYSIIGIVQNICIWGLEMGFTGNIPWLSADPLAGTVTPGGSEDVTVTFNSTGLDMGTYTGALVFSSNDPANPEVTVPVTLVVSCIPCPLPPPENVTAYEVSPFTVLLEWDEPMFGGVIRWDSGINNDGIGLTAGGTFQVAARFTSDQLGEYDGLFLTDVDIFPRSATADFILRVWTGPTGTQILLSQPITVVSEQWNTITLDTPIEIDASQDIYIGYEVTHDEGETPAGCDAGPAIITYGDLISLDGAAWEPLSGYGLDYNWNIAGHIGLAADGKQMTDIIQIGQTTPAATSAPVAGNMSKPVNALWMNTVREVLGYEIIRNDVVIGTTNELFFYDFLFEPGFYEYLVGAIYNECTSYADAITVYFPGVSEVATSKVAMYPNPASDVLNIEAGNITQVTIINNLGQVVYNKAMDMDNVQINTSDFDKGMYVVRIHTATKVHTEKLIIQ